MHVSIKLHLRFIVTAALRLSFAIGCGGEEKDVLDPGSGKAETCTPACEYKCEGASDGCGKTCPTNSCDGCCTEDFECRELSDMACGLEGEAEQPSDTFFENGVPQEILLEAGQWTGIKIADFPGNPFISQVNIAVPQGVEVETEVGHIFTMDFINVNGKKKSTQDGCYLDDPAVGDPEPTCLKGLYNLTCPEHFRISPSGDELDQPVEEELQVLLLKPSAGATVTITVKYAQCSPDVFLDPETANETQLELCNNIVEANPSLQSILEVEGKYCADLMD